MLVSVPMDSTDVHTATITKISDVKTWAQLHIEEGALVKVLHADKFDDFDDWSEAVVVCDDSEPAMEFIELSMTVLVAHTQKSIDEIIEAYLFRELHDFAY